MIYPSLQLGALVTLIINRYYKTVIYYIWKLKSISDNAYNLQLDKKKHE